MPTCVTDLTGGRRPVRLSRRAMHDLRRIGPGRDEPRLQAALEGLATGRRNVDSKAISGHPGWLRLRVGDWRILYIGDGDGWWVERIVSRGDLESAITSL